MDTFWIIGYYKGVGFWETIRASSPNMAMLQYAVKRKCCVRDLKDVTLKYNPYRDLGRGTT